jgi:hypothetical protein
MRLLELKEDGEFSLIEFFDKKVPPYATLSHTWGADEVTFEDLTKGSSKNNTDYSKIRFCGEQAASDCLEYFWVDTCCM